MLLHPSSQAVNDILAAAGLPGRVRILDRPAPTAAAAAEQLGCPVGAIANSLVFASADDEPVLIMTSGAHRVDLDRVRSDYGLDLHAGVRPTSSAPIPASRSAASLRSGIPRRSAPWSTGTWPRTTRSGRPAASRTRCSR